jgi:site-specific recombinase XerD
LTAKGDDMKTTIKKLKQAVDDYLLWMISSRYADATIKNYEQILNHFVDFIACHKIGWNQIFSSENLHCFDQSTKTQLAAVRGLCRYLVKQKRIVAPIEKEKYLLPNVYEQYLNYYATTRQTGNRRIKSIRRVLAAFDGYLENTKIKLAALTIEHIDAFFADFNGNFSQSTCKVYRSIVRGFLSYLFHQRHTLKRDLAPLVVGAPIFARAKPPTFLRADELKRLFDNIDLSSQSGLRTYAMLQLAYTLGLRPIEICQITLDNISFRKAELNINWRKCHNPLKLPVAEVTIKAIAAYIIGVRPQSALRTLFLSLHPPYGPITPTTVHYYFKTTMHQINPAASVYWLRHTYAQNLLEAGVSLFEIKELMGHDSIESTRKYLLIHIKLMREVLFDE